MLSQTSRTGRIAVRLVPLLAAAAAFLVFLPALDCGFVAWDDPQGFLANTHYRGFGVENLRWMATTTYLGNYQPLSWLSSAVDYKLWGLNPFGYHLGNLLFHAANAVLLYFVCLMLSPALGAEGAEPGRPPTRGPAIPSGWPSVAALLGSLFWSVHPLRVESVAWATERRDVLSAFFYLLTLLCYVRWTRSDQRRWWWTALVAYFLSLLSKAMGMTLPVALLILDAYPLRRLSWGAVKEKLPFFVLAAAAAGMGYWGQAAAKATLSWDQFGFLERLARSAYASVFYLEKTFIPVGLSPFYEMHLPLNPFAPRFVWSALAACLLAVLVWRWAKRLPGLAAAAAFYAVSVAPVLGLVAVGNHLAADRYTYIPSLGFSVLAAGALARVLASERPRLRAAVLAGAVLLAAALAALTWRQCGFWKDTDSLWGRVLALAPDTAAAHHNLGTALAAKGDYAAGVRRYRRALTLQPHSPLVRESLADALYNQGNAALRAQRPQDAVRLYQEALAVAPGLAETYNNLGLALAQAGRSAEARPQYLRALGLRPGFAAARYNLGNALSDLGRLSEAQDEYEKALKLDQDLLDARFNLANILARQGRWREAAAQYRAVLARSPAFPGAQENLAKVRRLGGF